jgi:proline dehydrogenase
MLRSFFLYLSSSARSRSVLMSLPFATRMARRFVAGETLDDAVNTVRRLNAQGMLVSLDHLGENVHSEADAARSTQAYLELLDCIAEKGLKSNVSLKLTALGLDIGEEICVNNMRRILQRAQEKGSFVRIDMEGTPYTERTLRVYRTLRDEYGFKNVGAVIQAYLYRSENDVRELASEGANIRLCKGAYNEPPTLAFPQKAQVDANYIRLMQIYLDEPSREAGAYIGVATHDENMIAATKEYVAGHNIGKDQFEFQMLYGIRPQAQQQLVAEGYKVRIYVPYGKQWYPYFMRRLAERPANVWFLLKNLFQA